LGGIYPWAGNYHHVMMSKDGFPFAAPAFIPNLMAEFEQKILARHTPCRGDDENVAESLAIVHVELVLVHPFREGNGRLARLLAMLMGLKQIWGQIYLWGLLGVSPKLSGSTPVLSAKKVELFIPIKT
jgi:cell filamentation protein